MLGGELKVVFEREDFGADYVNGPVDNQRGGGGKEGQERDAVAGRLFGGQGGGVD